MKSHSPTLEGFGTLYHHPSLGWAEIAWRWSFGFAGTLLLSLCLLEYLDTLPVTARDLLLLNTRQPALISQALAHIFRGSLPRLVSASLVLVPALAVAWIAIASFGRVATVETLIRHRDADSLPHGRGFKSVVGLNFLRAVVTLAAFVGCLAAGLLGGLATSDKDPSPGSALLIFMTVVMLVTMVWSLLNWFLSIAALFAVADGRNTFGAIADTVDFFRARPGPVAAATAWFGLAHGVVFFVASTVVAFPLAFASLLPAGVVLGGVLLVTLVYFAIVDFLYAGRLAAYAAILETPSVPVVVVMPSQVEPESRVDQDEPILSDQTES